MYEIRRFNNSDPPHLAEIWKSQPPLRGMMQPMSASLLEVCVFSKQYFEPEGMLVATRDEVPVGFAHAGFGPDEGGAGIDRELGVTQMVLWHASIDHPELGDQLLHASEAYLRSQGAKVLYGGGIHPLNPFYLGLYGGSELPGVLESDQRQTQLFKRNHYTEVGNVVVLQRDLVRIRSFLSRNQRQVKREMIVECDPSPCPPGWFHACQSSGIDQLAFTLIRRRDQKPLGRVVFWDIEPLASSWGIRTAGLCDLYIETPYRRHGLATYLLNEAFKEVLKRGISVVETHTMAENMPALALYQKLGFTQVDGGVAFRHEQAGGDA